MRSSDKTKSKGDAPAGPRPASLKDMAEQLALSPATLSIVLNGSPGSDAIPQETQDRIFAEARRLNYRPNFLARSLRARRSFSVGVMIPELSDGYSALVLSGIEDYLLSVGYIFLVASHRHDPKLIEKHPQLLHDRSVEGLIGVDTPIQKPLPMPVVSVSGHGHVPGITNIVLDHDRAAELALEHLMALGHRHIAFCKGQAFSSDTDVRWKAIVKTARRLRLRIAKELVTQLEGQTPSPEVGYIAARKILASGKFFTAYFAFNDIAAFGAIRAFREAGFGVPEDISVVGFDDVSQAAYHIPALTTIRQPLAEMGALAAKTLIERINSDKPMERSETLQVLPALIARESTGPAPPASGPKGHSLLIRALKK
jgi:LacI family transcriptional regulator